VELFDHSRFAAIPNSSKIFHRVIEHAEKGQVMTRRSKPLALLITLLAGSLILPAVSTAEDAVEEPDVFYFLGAAVGRSLQRYDLSPAEFAIVIEGLTARVEGTQRDLDEKVWGPKLQAIATARFARKAEKEKVESANFVTEQAKTEGADQKPSGLIITTTEEGTGASPVETDTVRVHYHGSLRDGTVFDSSVDRGQPAEFPLNRVIPCWTEGLQLMKKGGKSRLVCPPDIAYGDKGMPPTIPGGAALVFDVELLDIVSN
jgi:FKBP-type peptidyl-prolyl cis-trans isomerase FkpA